MLVYWSAMSGVNGVRRCAAAWGLAGWVAGWAVGCGTLRITPPASVEDPVRVYVADYGRTARLLLPGGPGRAGGASATETMWLEYTYGDWNWYAKGNTSLLDGAAALLLPTKATLGRREVRADGSRPRVPAEAIHEIEVERLASERLSARLDRVFTAAVERVDNAEHGLRFVRLDEDYWLCNQSSTRMKRWLEELGCDVRGWTLIARFEVVGGSEP